jgi:hypothetical protein
VLSPELRVPLLGPITKRDQIFVSCSSGTKTRIILSWEASEFGNSTRHLRIAHDQELLSMVSKYYCMEEASMLSPDFRVPLGPIVRRDEIFVACSSGTKPPRTASRFRSLLDRNHWSPSQNFLNSIVTVSKELNS